MDAKPSSSSSNMVTRESVLGDSERALVYKNLIVLNLFEVSFKLSLVIVEQSPEEANESYNELSNVLLFLKIMFSSISSKYSCL